MYDYNTQKKILKTDNGLTLLVRIVKRIESLNGNFVVTEAWTTLGTYSGWDAMACMDYLEEKGFIRKVKAGEAYQHTVYTRTH